MLFDGTRHKRKSTCTSEPGSNALAIAVWRTIPDSRAALGTRLPELNDSQVTTGAAATHPEPIEYP